MKPNTRICPLDPERPIASWICSLCRYSETCQSAAANQLSPFTLKCYKCDYKWLPRTQAPTQCPRCKSRYWNRKPDV